MSREDGRSHREDGGGIIPETYDRQFRRVLRKTIAFLSLSGIEMSMHLTPKLQVDIVVSKVDPELVVAAANAALHTGEIGDGKIFVYDVEDVVILFHKRRNVYMNYSAAMLDQIIPGDYIFRIIIFDAFKRSVFPVLCFDTVHDRHLYTLFAS